MKHERPDPCGTCGLPHYARSGGPRVYRTDGRCPLCAGFKPRGLRWCRTCRNTYEQAHRKTFDELSPEQRRKAIARAYLRVYVQRGVIKRKGCEWDGCRSKQRAQAHHHDYSKPLEVRWLCKRHHRQHHESERQAQAAA